jgi:predicted AlkP superfamily pyrophosphatase or phosphodiesterase
MFWPGADVPIHGTYPADWVRYYEPFSADQRVRTVIDWLRRPVAERPRLLTLYFEDVDTKGHRFDPGSPELKEAVRNVDKALADLIARTEALGQPLNLMIVSDHGMAATHSDRAVDLDTLLPRDAYLLINAGAIVELNPLPGREAEVSRALVKKHPHFECWNKADVPARFAYGKNPRVPAIVCLTETGWEVWQGPPRWQGAGGDHGFDPADPAMRALFIASGPAFVRGTTLPDFDNIHVYPLLARVAGVAPLASDGDAGVLAGALVAR